MNKNLEEFKAYLLSRKDMPRTNYYLESLKEIEEIKKKYNHKPRLLLHACCVICACWPIEFLHEVFDITILYNNSNIYPSEEYTKRLNELKRFVKERWNDAIQIIEPTYDNDAYNELLEPRKDDPEGWKRCFLCYETRMDEGFDYANKHQFDYFTTVMTFSRQKDSQKMNEIGKQLQTKYDYTKYFYSDFKKADGQKKANTLAEEYCLYKQNYCGCKYSLRDEH